MPRPLEVAVATIGLLLLLPMLLLVAGIVCASDGRPVIYRARRIGLGGREFFLLKFRTMVVGADKNGTGLTTHLDKRVTRLGNVLRRFKLDELPQLVNVLRGDMSFVGPRPEDPRYVTRYREEYRRILEFRPGITSPASLAYRNESSLLQSDMSEEVYLQDILPDKLDTDLKYMVCRSTLSDLRIILKTVLQVAR